MAPANETNRALSDSLEGRRVLLSGAFATMSRATAKRVLTEAGATVQSKANSKTDLIVHDGLSLTTEAYYAVMERRVPLMTETALIEELRRAGVAKDTLEDADASLAKRQQTIAKEYGPAVRAVKKVHDQQVARWGLPLGALVRAYLRAFARRKDVVVRECKLSGPCPWGRLGHRHRKMPHWTLSLFAELDETHFCWVFEDAKADIDKYSPGYNGGLLHLASAHRFDWTKRPAAWTAETYDQDSMVDELYSEASTFLRIEPGEKKTDARLVFTDADDPQTFESWEEYLTRGARRGFVWYWQLPDSGVPTALVDKLYAHSLPRDTPAKTVVDKLQKLGLSSLEAEGIVAWLGQDAVILLPLDKPVGPPKWSRSKRAKASAEDLLAHFTDPDPKVHAEVMRRLPAADFDRRALIEHVRIPADADPSDNTFRYNFGNQREVSDALTVLCESGEATSEIVGELLDLVAEGHVFLHHVTQVIQHVPPRAEWAMPLLQLGVSTGWGEWETLAKIPGHLEALEQALRSGDDPLAGQALLALMTPEAPLAELAAKVSDVLHPVADDPTEVPRPNGHSSLKTRACVALAVADSGLATRYASELAKGLHDLFGCSPRVLEVAAAIDDDALEPFQDALRPRLDDVQPNDGPEHPVYQLALRTYRHNPQVLDDTICVQDYSTVYGFDCDDDTANRGRLTALRLLADLDVAPSEGAIAWAKSVDDDTFGWRKPHPHAAAALAAHSDD